MLILPPPLNVLAAKSDAESHGLEIAKSRNDLLDAPAENFPHKAGVQAHQVGFNKAGVQAHQVGFNGSFDGASLAPAEPF